MIDLKSKTATCLQCGKTIRVIEGSDTWGRISTKSAWEEAELVCPNCRKTTAFVVDVDDPPADGGSGLPPSS